MAMSLSLALCFLALAVPLILVHHRLKRRPLKNIRGPPSSSIILGNELDIRNQDEAGDLDFKWISDYGTAWRTAGCFGEDILMLADPKALQYIFHTASAHFPKRADAVQSAKLLMGQGLVSVMGDQHTRQRRIMSPAFSAAQIRSFLPSFRGNAAKLTERIKDELKSKDSGQRVFNMTRWLAKTTLDAIGETAFDYTFGAAEDSDNELMKSFVNLFADTMIHPPIWDIMFKSLWRYIPESILTNVQYIPTWEYQRFRGYLNLAKSIGKELVDQKFAAILDQKDNRSRDVMSVLVQANASEDDKRRLDDDELHSQMATLMLAGHDTTATTLSWLLWELSKHPGDQDKIRAEIRKARENITARGDADFTVADFDGMEFTNAVLKEVLRFDAIVPNLVRVASRDDVIPLSHPIMTKSGEMISEIPILKGQSLTISICGYNRLESVWGNDAHTWNPRRFLENSKERKTNVGVVANLMTFSAGTMGCLGWRFAMVELQAIIIELIENFEFRLPIQGDEVQRVPAGLMIPMLRGKFAEGTQMPLRVSLAK